MSSFSAKYLIVVTGPTAVGKTELCIDLALHFSTEIVSADSRQCYQGMSIGTAQPTAAELRMVPHHLVNFVPIQDLYNAGQYERDALQVLSSLFTSHDIVVMTGGTGLYIQAVCEGLAPMPPIPPTVRHKLNERLHQEGLYALVAELKALDPHYHQVVDQLNPQRVIRALEVCLTTGKTYSSFRANIPQERPFQVIKIGLTRDRPVLYQRIDDRVEQMMAQGLLKEVEELYPYRHHNALKTVGYRELFGYIAKEYDLKEAIRLLKRNTRRYAKRQLTWLRRDAMIDWFHPDEKARIFDHVYQQIPIL